MPTDTTTLTDREKVIQLAEKVMGWKAVEVGTFKLLVRLERQNGFPLEYRTGCKGGSAAMWNPLESMEDAFMMQERITGHDRIVYRRHIQDIISGDNPRKFVSDEDLLYASARQRCDGALRLLESR